MNKEKKNAIYSTTQKRTAEIHLLTLANIGLYLVMSAIYNSIYGVVDPNPQLKFWLILTLLILLLCIGLAIILEISVLFVSKGLHGIIAAVLIVVNILIAGNSLFAVALTGANFMG